jgi:hypothetical protein
LSPRRKKKKEPKPAPPEQGKCPPHNYKPVGTVTRPDDRTYTVWECTRCPSRMETL